MLQELLLPFGLKLQMYGICLALGFLACYVLARWVSKWSGRNPSDVDTLIMLAAVGGVIGARIVFVIQNWERLFADCPLRMFAFWEGGLVFYGGFLLAAAIILLYGWLKGEKIRTLADFCVLFVPLGHAFGRLGCFFYGCCFGGRTSSALGICFPRGSHAWQHQVACGEVSKYSSQALPVWPTQLIEAVGCLLLFFVLLFLYKVARWRKGLCVGVYCVAYAGLRFLGECLRDDPRGAFHFGMSFSQLISCGLFLMGMVFLGFAMREKKDGTVGR